MLEQPRVQRWTGAQPPSEAEIRRRCAAENLAPYLWSNGPGDAYAPHTHAYHKVIFVVRGSIAFGLPELGQRLHLEAGDRLDLPPGVLHDAVVGSQGVACLEGHRRQPSARDGG
jgi:quercetin dioxygenase-like cupin family protein